MNEVTHKLTLTPISDLLGLNFFIPSYQRGYRWTSSEVTALLDDIYEFMLENEKSDSSVFYCLQPLVVYQDGNHYQVVDGQQRLTTIYIILSYLKDIANMLGKQKYSLYYETRPNSADYLDHIDHSLANDNVDFFHIYNAYQAVSDWFLGKDGILKVKMLSTITASNAEGRNVKFIWYEIDQKEAINVFTRINIGKIPLTNAELIKALLVKDKNFNVHNQAKKISISTEWDEIEKKLNSPNLWYFLSNLDHQVNYDNKIEYILDIMSSKSKDHEKLHTFFYFNNIIEKKKSEQGFDIDDVWMEIKDNFLILEEWYNNHDLYHYVGFLLATGTSIKDILQWSVGKSKADFIEYIRNKIKSQFNKVEIDELTFEKLSDRRIIKKILLLYNLETILRSRKTHVKFPFDRYKTESWDIEHINPQNPFDNLVFYADWCLDVLEYLTGEQKTIDEMQIIDSFHREELESQLLENLSDDDKTVVKLIIDILNDSVDFRAKTEELSQQLFTKYNGFAADDVKQNDSNHISNLTLLDASTNRSYGNSIFPIKRNAIIKQDRAGIFIPICTKNVFLKYYSQQMSDVMFWKKSDADAYFKDMQAALSYYFTDKK